MRGFEGSHRGPAGDRSGTTAPPDPSAGPGRPPSEVVGAGGSWPRPSPGTVSRRRSASVGVYVNLAGRWCWRNRSAWAARTRPSATESSRLAPFPDTLETVGDTSSYGMDHHNSTPNSESVRTNYAMIARSTAAAGDLAPAESRASLLCNHTILRRNARKLTQIGADMLGCMPRSAMGVGGEACCCGLGWEFGGLTLAGREHR